MTQDHKSIPFRLREQDMELFKQFAEQNDTSMTEILRRYVRSLIYRNDSLDEQSS